MNLSLFPIAADAPPLMPSSDVVRRIEHKAGPFRELQSGKPTGREFQLVQLIDGRIRWEFTTGQRVDAPVACSGVLVDDAILYGVFVEVEV